jgi:asparagine synthase (glutamine-hydrolysing)
MPLFAFSIVFPSDPDADESRYSQAVLRHAGVTGVQIVPPPLGRDEVIAQVAARRELPDFPHDFTGNSVRRAMATRGIRIALTGSGGDTGLTGSHFHCADLLRQGRLVRFWRRYRDVARQSATAWSASDVIPSALWPLLPRTVRKLLRPVARRLGGYHVPRWIPPDFAARAGLTIQRPLRDVPAGRLARTDIVDGFDNGWTHMALDLYQRGSTEWSIEDRHPFFDRRVLEFVASLPDEQRWQNGQTRYVLRRAMGDRLPAEVGGRTETDKGDFSHVYPPALEALGGASLFSERMWVVRNGWVAAAEAGTMYRKMLVLRGKRDMAYADIAWRLWVVAALEMWYSGVFERSGREDQWISSETGSMSVASFQPAVVARGHTSAPC